jgi:hypothetical protein
MNGKRSILFTAALLLACNTLLAQRPVYGPRNRIEKGIAIHFTNPISVLSKIGIMAEYKLGVQRSVMFSYTSYRGYFPGYQVAAAYRQYFQRWSNRDNIRHENFMYVRAGVGNSDYTPPDWLKDGEAYVAPGDYFFVGCGIGRHYNFGAFFLESILGVKYSGVPVPIANYNERIFYVTGPGAIVEINFNFGFQF